MGGVARRLNRFLISKGDIEAWKIMVKILELEIFLIIHQFGLNQVIYIGGQNLIFITDSKSGQRPRFGGIYAYFLIGCMYKVVAKIFASRLRKVIGEVISTTQRFCPR